MSDESLLFDKHLKTLKILMPFSGISLQSRKRSTWNKVKHRCILILNSFLLNYNVLGAILWFVDGLANGKSIVYLTYIAPCVTLSFVSNFKGYYFMRNEDEINDLVDDLKELEIKINGRKRTEGENKILIEETKFLATVIKMSNVLNLFLLATFAVSPLILIVYKYFKTQKLDLIIPFLILYPFDALDIRIWPFVYVHQIWLECIVVLYVCISDYLFYICCSFIRIQFRLLQYSLENLMCVKNRSQESVQARLIELIKWHQKLIRTADTLEVIFTKSTLFNFISSSAIICFTGFNVMFVDFVAFEVTFLVFMSTSLLQIFLLCFFGDMLMRSSMEVGDAIYKIKWYEGNPAVIKILLLMLTRAQKPCKVTAFSFADVNLRAFMKILSTAWSYFALLKTIYSPSRA